MYERSWEGEVEIRVPGKDSLRVVARLWRHDDAGGTDWGGQLEIDVATATKLGTGEYAIVLPDGRESTVRLSRGASRARSASPTFAGRGTHVVVAEDSQRDPVRQRLRAMLADRFGIAHATVEMETRETRCQEAAAIGH